MVRYQTNDRCLGAVVVEGIQGGGASQVVYAVVTTVYGGQKPSGLHVRFARPGDSAAQFRGVSAARTATCDDAVFVVAFPAGLCCSAGLGSRVPGHPVGLSGVQSRIAYRVLLGVAGLPGGTAGASGRPRSRSRHDASGPVGTEHRSGNVGGCNGPGSVMLRRGFCAAIVCLAEPGARGGAPRAGLIRHGPGFEVNAGARLPLSGVPLRCRSAHNATGAPAPTSADAKHRPAW